MTQEISTAQKVEFLQSFRRLPPEQRLEVWRSSYVIKGKATLANGASAELRRLLIAEGIDTVPYLARMVRNSKESIDWRFKAMEVLVNMDTWVPDSDSDSALRPPDWFYVPELKFGGTRSLFLDVDGRRIGKEGLDAVHWAAQQSQEEDLRFYARSITGFLEKDLRVLNIEEQLRRWRDAVAKNGGRGFHWSDTRAYQTANCLRGLLIERVPDSLPLLATLLQSERNPYVREEIIRVFELIDARRFRLRGSLLGQDAIEAIHGAIARGNLKPLYDTEQKREERWQRLRAQFYEDNFELHPGAFEWGIFANAMEIWFGDKTTNGLVNRFVDLKKTSPEFRSFLTFLTKVDPFFPSWEYTFDGPVIREQVLHPLFRKKVEHYHREWMRFQASKQM